LTHFWTRHSDLIAKTFPDNPIACLRTPPETPESGVEMSASDSTPLRHITLIGTNHMITLDKFLPVYMIAATVLVIANGVWAFRDARRRGRSGVLIGLLVLCTFPLGVILWLLVRLEIAAKRHPRDPDADIKKRANAGLL
jgi:hypothetical protein